MIQKINISEKFDLITEHFRPKTVMELNGQAFLRGHRHDAGTVDCSLGRLDLPFHLPFYRVMTLAIIIQFCVFITLNSEAEAGPKGCIYAEGMAAFQPIPTTEFQVGSSFDEIHSTLEDRGFPYPKRTVRGRFTFIDNDADDKICPGTFNSYLWHFVEAEGNVRQERTYSGAFGPFFDDGVCRQGLINPMSTTVKNCISTQAEERIGSAENLLKENQ